MVIIRMKIMKMMMTTIIMMMMMMMHMLIIMTIIKMKKFPYKIIKLIKIIKKKSTRKITLNHVDVHGNFNRSYLNVPQLIAVDIFI
jgi:hypothetical protein